jgi:putative hemolysin
MIKTMVTQNARISGPHSGPSTATVFEVPAMAPSLTRLPYIQPPAVEPDTSPQHPAGEWQPIELGRYRVTLAQTLAEREAACRLRFKVFNIELGEGLQSSYKTGLDTDQFDLFCEQLIVEDRITHNIVGTYRMQTGLTAAQMLGYYSEQEFDFTPYESIRNSILELGRASIDREHRSSEVLTLLWRGIAQYSRVYNLRYLIGCSSLNSQDPKTGWQIYRQLSEHLVVPEFRTNPTSSHILPYTEEAPETGAKIPKLLRTYIGIGAKICGAPAWDREFGTIDFLTLQDMRELTPAARVRFLTDTQ